MAQQQQQQPPPKGPPFPPAGPPLPPAYDLRQQQLLPPPPPPQQQHDWQALVPDTSLLPPPPPFVSGWDRSPANNATELEAEAGVAWCDEHPLLPPMSRPDPAMLIALRGGDVYLSLGPREPSSSSLAGGGNGWFGPKRSVTVVAPPALTRLSTGVWRCKTAGPRACAFCALSWPPVYLAQEHSPLAAPPPLPPPLYTESADAAGAERGKAPATASPSGRGWNGGRSRDGAAITIYYEVQLVSCGSGARSGTVMGADDDCLAMGFAAMPYPSFRLPGWHRASMAVHGDDGHRFVNDMWGGRDFLSEGAFRAGERLGIGMTFSAPRGAGPVGAPPIAVECFFTRRGRLVGQWDLHEEVEAGKNLPIAGLEGYHDLSAAVGACGSVEFEVLFDPARWTYKPWEHGRI